MTPSARPLAVLLIGALFSLSGTARSDDDTSSRDKRSSADLVRALEAEDPAHRAAAEAELRRRGTAALGALRAARREARSDDMERARIERILARILARIEVDWHRSHVPEGMVYIPAGQLERPREKRPWGPSGERVMVAAFYIDRCEVSVGAWRTYRKALTDAGQSEHRIRLLWQPEADMAADLPAVRVNWLQAKGFAAYHKGRLPTAQEFERALRGSGLADWPWGDAKPDGRANLRDSGPGHPVAVGSQPKGASAFGVHDLVGNVSEWSATVIRQGQVGRYPLLLGGSYRDPPSAALTWRGLERMQARLDQRQRVEYVGFRVARDPAPLPKSD